MAWEQHVEHTRARLGRFGDLDVFLSSDRYRTTMLLWYPVCRDNTHNKLVPVILKETLTSGKLGLREEGTWVCCQNRVMCSIGDHEVCYVVQDC